MARIICTGLGPGNPDLMAVRSDRLIRGATQVAYFRKKGRKGQARQIVEGMLRADAVELPMEYPVTTEIPFDSPEYIRLLAEFYDDWANRLAAMEGEVIVLCAQRNQYDRMIRIAGGQVREAGVQPHHLLPQLCNGSIALLHSRLHLLLGSCLCCHFRLQRRQCRAREQAQALPVQAQLQQTPSPPATAKGPVNGDSTVRWSGILVLSLP